MPIRAAVCLAGPWRVFRKDLLAAKGAVATASSVRVATDISVRVANVVPVFLVECVVRDLVEAAPPEHERLLEVESDALQEQRVLKTTVVFEVGIAAKRPVQVRHAGREMLRKVINVAGCDLGARRCR